MGTRTGAKVKRVVVLGGLGQFGRTAVKQLRAMGISAKIASRSAQAEIRIDANDPVSIRAVLAEGDLVVDAAGPFHLRSTALLDSAIEIGFDVVDINDNLTYAETVLARSERIARAGIRVLSSASSVSAVAAAIVRQSGVRTPVRATGFIVPGSRHTANAGSALSLLQSVGRPVRALREGELRTVRGWAEARRFVMPEPVGPIRGRLFETADSVYLPRIWPSLREVDTYVDTNTPGVDTLLRLGGRCPRIRRLLERWVRLGTWTSRQIGSTAGGLGYEIEGADGEIKRFAVLSGKSGSLTAVAPAVLATRAIVEGRFEGRGLVLPDGHVEPAELIAFLERWNLTVAELT